MIRTIVFVFLFVSSADFVMSQSKLSIGISVNSGASYRFLSTPYNDEVLESRIEDSDFRELPQVNFKAGLFTSFSVKGPLELWTEIRYINFRYKNDNRRRVTSGVPPFLVHEIRAHNFIEVPVLLSYQMNQGNSKFMVSGGVGFAQHIYSTNTELITNSDLSTRTETRISKPSNIFGYRSFNANAIIRFGWSVPVTQKLNLGVIPEVSFGILSLSKTRIKTRLWSAGLGIYLSTGFSRLLKD
ncbi:PorT family protein [bacterium]|nr:PorT family protein [bacterium]